MKPRFKIILICLIILDLLAWSNIVFGTFGKRLEMYFFDVGQGDSEMIVMPGNVKILIDGGPDNGKVVSQLDDSASWHDRYIDLVMISHAELDHFGGLLDVVQRYEIGMIIYNGNGSDSESFKELAQRAKEQKIPVIVVAEGDSIEYLDNKMKILSAQGKNRNEGASVAKFTGGGVSALFTGDIGRETEKELIKDGDIKADIIKIPHHGSKFSATEEFLKSVQPKIAIIEVGKNSYGHPTKEVLERIKKTKARLFRTDTDGMVRLVVENGTIKQYED
ncbi:MAG: ComEC [Candidatus Wolfebacteria bacterium GW2011_GWA1_47_6]|nr:MAG: ComEC [Candidatus Wolfebacteria bacterium GW2011_GWA1_47_6]